MTTIQQLEDINIILSHHHTQLNDKTVVINFNEIIDNIIKLIFLNNPDYLQNVVTSVPIYIRNANKNKEDAYFIIKHISNAILQYIKNAYSCEGGITNNYTCIIDMHMSEDDFRKSLIEFYTLCIY